MNPLEDDDAMFLADMLLDECKVGNVCCCKHVTEGFLKPKLGGFGGNMWPVGGAGEHAMTKRFSLCSNLTGGKSFRNGAFCVYVG